jgi:hypothetical protein
VRSTIDIEIRAGAQLVFALARDVERWERLLPALRARGGSAAWPMVRFSSASSRVGR